MFGKVSGSNSGETPADPAVTDKGQRMRVAYVMSRFPNLTETFVLYEIVSLEGRGVRVDVYPLLRTHQAVVHAEAERIARGARYRPFLSPAVLRAHAHFLRRRPRAYLRVLSEVLRGTFGSANFFMGAIGVFPKAVRFAYDMQADGVTHVHAHFANHPTIAALIVHRLTGIPFSFTAHGHDLHVERRMLDAKVEAASFVVTVSSYNQRLIRDECPNADPDKVRVVHCGTDTELFAPREREAGSPLTLICIGSLIEVKGHRYLIEACKLLSERGVDLRCHLIGEGSKREALAAQIEAAGLGQRITIHGGQSRERIVELMGASDVIVQPSVPTRRGSREGIPVSLMEGMASGLPVVASRISGIPELVEDGRSGFLVPPRDAEALAGALLELRAASLRRRLGQAGRERVLAEFELGKNAVRLEALFASHGAADPVSRTPAVAVPDDNRERVG